MQLLLYTPYGNVKESPVHSVYSIALEQWIQYKFLFVSINSIIVAVSHLENTLRKY